MFQLTYVPCVQYLHSAWILDGRISTTCFNLLHTGIKTFTNFIVLLLTAHVLPTIVLAHQSDCSIGGNPN